MSMDNYVRRQVIMSNIEYNLIDLYKQREFTLISLKRLDKQIKKHEDFLEELEREEEEEQ
jgi:hypothetical protein